MDNQLMNLDKKRETEHCDRCKREKRKCQGRRGQAETDSTVTLCEMPPMEKPADQLKLCEVGDVTAAHEEGAAGLEREKDDWERHTSERNEKVGEIGKSHSGKGVPSSRDAHVECQLRRPSDVRRTAHRWSGTQTLMKLVAPVALPDQDR